MMQFEIMIKPPSLLAAAGGAAAVEPTLSGQQVRA
jgi:hypothetical protein